MPANIADKDLMQDVLSMHKFEAGHITNCILEAANDQLRQDYLNELNTVLKHQKQVFDLMNQRGWYQVKMANPQDISQAQSKLSGAATGMAAGAGYTGTDANRNAGAAPRPNY